VTEGVFKTGFEGYSFEESAKVLMVLSNSD